MHKRAQDLISELRLQPHLEGGYFREVFRSPHNVQPLDERSARSALTTIYFLLIKGQYGRWHRVASNETWHFYEGDPLEVYWIDDQDAYIESCCGQVLQMFVRCAWSPPGVGKRHGLLESTASSGVPLLPDSSSRILRCSPEGQQRWRTSRRCVPSLPNSPKWIMPQLMLTRRWTNEQMFEV